MGERKQGQESATIHAFDVRSIPAPVAALSSHLEQIASEIRRHPSRVIEGAVAWSKPVFHPLEPLVARVHLKNAGVLPLTLANPLSPGHEAGLRLALRNAAGSAAGVEMEVAHLRPRAPGETDEMVTLDPGDVLEFELRKKVYLAPGDYDGQLVYRNLVDVHDNPQFVDGELSLAIGRCAVQRHGRP